jgi:hypothetical protein
MARTKTDVQQPAPAPDFIDDKFDELTRSANELVAITEKDKANVQALAVQLGYTGPLDPDSLEQMCHIKAAAAANSIFEYGAALLLLRESCLHGDWMRRFESMSISRRTAHNYMAIALKFKGVDVRAALAGLGVNKLLELSALDDGEITALAAGESVRGVTIGAVDRMSVLELKKKIADLEANLEAAQEVASGKEQKINELTRRVKKFNVDVDLPAAFAEASSKATEAVNTILTMLQRLEDLRNQAMNDMRPEDEHGQAVHLGQLQSLGMVMFGGYTAINEKLKRTETAFSDTLEKLLAD